MTVNELMAAFKASRRSLSTRPSAHRAFVTETKTPVRNRPEQAAVYASATEALEVLAEREPKPTKRSRKPTPCKCACNTEGCAAKGCGSSNPCGHKGCGLS
jgi:hypothetical protein